MRQRSGRIVAVPRFVRGSLDPFGCPSTLVLVFDLDVGTAGGGVDGSGEELGKRRRSAVGKEVRRQDGALALDEVLVEGISRVSGVEELARLAEHAILDRVGQLVGVGRQAERVVGTTRVELVTTEIEPALPVPKVVLLILDRNSESVSGLSSNTDSEATIDTEPAAPKDNIDASALIWPFDRIRRSTLIDMSPPAAGPTARAGP